MKRINDIVRHHLQRWRRPEAAPTQVRRTADALKPVTFRDLPSEGDDAPDFVQQLIASIQEAAAAQGHPMGEVHIVSGGNVRTLPPPPPLVDGRLTETAFVGADRGEKAHFNIDWAQWSHMMTEMVPARALGWTPCRYALRSRHPRTGHERAGFVMGAVRGCIGVHTIQTNCCMCEPFDLSDPEAEPTPIQTVERKVAVLCHLWSGEMLAVFDHVGVAMMCGEVTAKIMGSAATATEIDHLNATRDAVMRAWFDLGVVPSDFMHAHMENVAGPSSILVASAEIASHGRPEKPS